jgi:hypothetical protein
VYGYNQIVADDWMCDEMYPVTDVHWWGSYPGWDEIEPPPIAPFAFHIGIWTDVPAGEPPSFSHPGILIWQAFVDRTDLNETYVGCDYYPDMPYDACFEYEYIIPDSIWFFQETPGTIYWLSIAAMYYDLPVDFPWGWKTRLPHWNDDAIVILIPTAPVLFDPYIEGYPIEIQETSWDMAFELTTGAGEEELREFGDAPEGALAYIQS